MAAGQQILANLGLAAGLHRVEPEALLAALHRAADDTLRIVVRRSAVGTLRPGPGRPGDRDAGRPVVRSLRGPTSIPALPGRGKTSTRPSCGSAIREIRAPVSGFINRRSVNPGDHVQAGQGLMSIQPLDEVYIEANFKETQLVRPDDRPAGRRSGWTPIPDGSSAAGSRGFAPATGAASSMLPPENATGNFVKVVQRIPVRIDLIEPNPRETPLLVGMSVDSRGRHQGPAGRPGRRQPAPRPSPARSRRPTHERDSPRRTSGSAARSTPGSSP